MRKTVADTNGGSLRSRSTASEQLMCDFGLRMRYACVRLGKIWLRQPPVVADTLIDLITLKLKWSLEKVAGALD